jgi:hypothetical protein
MGSSLSKTVRGGKKGKNYDLIHQNNGSKLQKCKKQINVIQDEVSRDVTHSKEERFKIMMITEKAKTQIDREDKPFTKNDLIAILLALNVIQIKDTDAIEKTFTIPELTSMIRGDIYDVSRMMTMEQTQRVIVDKPKGTMQIENGKRHLEIKNY